MTYRERAVRVAEGEARRKVREVGGNNRGPDVERYLRSTGLGPGYPWCAAFTHWCFRKAGLHLKFRNPASVGFFAEWARQHGYVVWRPKRGDCACWRLDADTWPDHVFFIRSARRLPSGYFYLSTVEGNTSSGRAGSQDDGGGVYFRKRIIRPDRLYLVRVPGDLPLSTSDRKRLKTLRAWILKRRRAGWSWKRLKATTNFREYKRKGGK